MTREDWSSRNNLIASDSQMQGNGESGDDAIREESAGCTGIIRDTYRTGADVVPIQYPLLPVLPSLSGHMHGTGRSNTHNLPLTGVNKMTDQFQFSSSQNHQIDCNMMNMNDNADVLQKPVPQFPNLGGDVNRLSLDHTPYNAVTAHSVSSGSTHFNTFQNPHLSKNFVTIRGQVAGGSQMTRQSREVYGCNNPWPQSVRNFTFNTVQSDYSQKLDGSFLTLGVGGSTVVHRDITSEGEMDAIPHYNISHGQASRNSLNPGPEMAGGVNSSADFHIFQNNMLGFSSLMQKNVGGQTLPNNDLTLTHSRSIGLGENRDATFADVESCKGSCSYPAVHSQAGLPYLGQCGVTSSPMTMSATQSSSEQLKRCYMQADRHCSSESSVISPFVEGTRSTIRQGQSAPAYQGTVPQIAEGGQIPMRIGLQPESPAYQGSAPQIAEGCQFPSGRGFQPATYQGSYPQIAEGGRFPIRPACPANQHTALQIAEHGRFPMRSLPQIAESCGFPTRMGIQTSPAYQINAPQIAEGGGLRMGIQTSPAYHCSAPQIAEDGGFPSRMGIQTSPAYHSSAPQIAEGGGFPTRMGIQTSPANRSGAPQIAEAYRGCAPQISDSGLYYMRTRIQPARQTFPVNDGNYAQVPGGDLFPKIPVQPASQVIPAAERHGTAQPSNIVAGPSHKRGALEHPQSATRAWRRRTKTTHPSICPSNQYLMQPGVPLAPHLAKTNTMPSLPSLAKPPKAAAVINITHQDFEETPPPSGYKCMICKRDLSYTSEGPMFQPARPPTTALLACGHVFHATCLERITPENEAKNPPCIPCAIGEN